MKHIKLFEQFVNEAAATKSDVETLKEWGHNAKLVNGTIVVKTEKFENPWKDKNKYTFYWDGESVWTEAGNSGFEYTLPVTNVSAFDDLIQSSDNTNWE